MTKNDKLDALLRALASQPAPDVPDGFMESVWERAGALSARRDQRMRIGLFLGLFAVGMGAGWGTVQTPVQAQSPAYVLAANADLSPAALLHAGP